MGAIPPDGYLGDSPELVDALAHRLRIDRCQIGDYVVIAQVNLPGSMWDIIVGPDVPIDLLPDLFRVMADQLEVRVQTMLS